MTQMSLSPWSCPDANGLYVWGSVPMFWLLDKFRPGFRKFIGLCSGPASYKNKCLWKNVCAELSLHYSWILLLLSFKSGHYHLGFKHKIWKYAWHAFACASQDFSFFSPLEYPSISIERPARSICLCTLKFELGSLNTCSCMYTMYAYSYYLCTHYTYTSMYYVCTHASLFMWIFFFRISIVNIIILAMPGYGSMETMIQMNAYASWVVC